MVFKCLQKEKSVFFQSHFVTTGCFHLMNNGLSDSFEAAAFDLWLSYEWAKHYTGMEYVELSRKIWGQV